MNSIKRIKKIGVIKKSFYLLIVLFASMTSFTSFSNQALNSIQNLVQQKDQSRKTLDQSNQQNNSKPMIYQFVLFYRSQCMHCQRFDPILKAYSNRSGISVKAYSTDGQALPDFPHTTPIDAATTAQYFGAGQTLRVPTLFIMNKSTQHVFPVSTGEMQYRELAQRMNNLMPKIIDYENKHSE